MPRILILTDSRGYALGRQLSDMDLYSVNIDLHIMPYSGARIKEVATKGLADCGQYSYDRVYFMAGVNNLSTKRRGIVFPKCMDRYKIFRDIMVDLHEARTELDKLAPEVVMCEIIGLSYWMYNNYDDDLSFPEGQNEIEAAIMRINEYIHDMNDERGVKGPCIADITHKTRGESRLEHRYMATLHDGLHFNECTAIKILDRLIASMLLNI